MLSGNGGGVEHGGDLRNADTCYHAGGTDGAGADTYLDTVGTCLDESLCSLSGGDVAGDQLNAGESALDGAASVQDALGMAVGGVQNQGVNTCVDESLCTLKNVLGNADGGGAEQSALGVLGGIRILLGFFDVLDGDQTLQIAVFIHQGELLDLAGAEDGLRLLQGGAHLAGDQVFLGHDLADGNIVAIQKTDVTVGQDPLQFALRVADGDTGDAVLVHQRQSVGDKVLPGEEEGLVDNTVFATLYTLNLVGLLLDRHILVNNADTAFPSDGDGHAGLRYGIHCRGDQRNVQTDGGGEVGGGVDVCRQNVAFCGDQQYVIVGKTFFSELFVKIHHRILCSFMYPNL